MNVALDLSGKLYLSTLASETPLRSLPFLLKPLLHMNFVYK